MLIGSGCLSILGQSQRQLRLISTVELRRNRLASEKLTRFNRMLGVCSAAGDFHGAERILQRAVKSEVAPDTLSFALVVAASAEARDVVRAEMWLRRLCLTGHAAAACHPEVISSLMDAGASELARVAAQQEGSKDDGDDTTEQPAETRLSSLLHVLRKQSDLSEREMAAIRRLWEEVLEQHRSDGLVPSRRTLRAMLQVLSRCSRHHEIGTLLKEMSSVGFRADSETFGALIDGASERKDVAQAEAFFKQARENGIEPTLPMLNSLIKGCAAAADVASAKKWYHRIYSEGLTPSILSFNSFLGACGTAGYEQEAESVLQDMLTAQLRPDGFSYLALIKAHGHKSAKEAERWFSVALSARVNVDTDPWEVKRLYADMQRRRVPANAATFLSVAHAYAVEGEVSKAEDLIYASQEAGYKLGSEEFSCLLLAYSWKPQYRSHKAERLFREMISERKILPTSRMLRYLRLAMGQAPAEALIEELGVSVSEAESSRA